MKWLLSSRGLFLLGFAILLSSNIIVLSGVASNRSGKPDTRIILTERELKLPSRISNENSGLNLKIDWRVLSENTGYDTYSGWRSPEWFDAEKLKTLGFNVAAHGLARNSDLSYKRPLPKEVFVVLEYDGDAYKEALNRTKFSLDEAKEARSSDPSDEKGRKKIEKAVKRLNRERFASSRLFAIDAGLDAGKLRAQYMDQTRFIITKGLAAPRSYYDKKKKQLSGYIKRLSIGAVHVPLKHRPMFDTILAKEALGGNTPQPPRYQVELGYGSRWEPWMISVQQM
jgi:Domain of unknown function (DUF4824)